MNYEDYMAVENISRMSQMDVYDKECLANKHMEYTFALGKQKNKRKKRGQRENETKENLELHIQKMKKKKTKKTRPEKKMYVEIFISHDSMA